MDISFFMNLVISYWYFGVFLVGFLSSFSLFLPTPAFLVVFLLAKTFDPFWLGLVAGLGAAVGEFTSYYVGWAGGKTILKKYGKKLDEVKKRFKQYKPSIIIFVFSAAPLPFDLVGIFCGAIKYPVKKFAPPLLAGKIIKYWVVAYAGLYSIEWISGLFGG